MSETKQEMYLENEMEINEKRYEQGFKEGKEQGFKKGVSQGFKEGFKEGKEQGYKECQRVTAKNLMCVYIPLDKISDATGLSINEIRNL